MPASRDRLLTFGHEYSMNGTLSRCVAQGYLLAEVPSNMLLARSRPSIFLPALMFTWVSPPLFARERLSTHWY
jgi:hypothetical protein